MKGGVRVWGQGSAQGQMAGSWEHSNEPPCYTEMQNFLTISAIMSGSQKELCCMELTSVNYSLSSTPSISPQCKL